MEIAASLDENLTNPLQVLKSWHYHHHPTDAHILLDKKRQLLSN